MEKPEHTLLIFVDGLGIGENTKEKNPCCSSFSLFQHFSSEIFPKKIEPNGYVVALDANFGVKGLPQSATGQTALLTGVNASQLIGRHLNGFPNEKLRQVIKEFSLLKQFKQLGLGAAFLNAFRPPFFDYNPYDIIKYLSVTSVTNLYAELPFFNLDDLRNEKSIFQDIVGDALREKGFDVPYFSPEKAGDIIAQQSQNFHFSLFEYFQTDKAGHSQDMDRALHILNTLGQFLNSILNNVPLQKTLVIVTSDHGNIEDLSFKGHTNNPVMTLVFGAGASRFQNLCTILDIYPAILSNYK